MNNDISVAVLPYVVEHIANRDGAEALGKNVYAAADVSDVIDVIDGYASLLHTVWRPYRKPFRCFALVTPDRGDTERVSDTPPAGDVTALPLVTVHPAPVWTNAALADVAETCNRFWVVAPELRVYINDREIVLFNGARIDARSGVHSNDVAVEYVNVLHGPTAYPERVLCATDVKDEYVVYDSRDLMYVLPARPVHTRYYARVAHGGHVITRVNDQCIVISHNKVPKLHFWVVSARSRIDTAHESTERVEQAAYNAFDLNDKRQYDKLHGWIFDTFVSFGFVDVRIAPHAVVARRDDVCMFIGVPTEADLEPFVVGLFALFKGHNAQS